ncbi:MAG: lipocalin [Methylococcaceae bacterium]|nr:lipocalin [Methylococcaceae bacterium]
MRKLLFLFIVTLFINGCSQLTIPKGVYPVEQFNVHKYQGKWYEIARLENSFEEGLDHITAEYTLLEKGGLKVINRGFSIEDNEWKTAEGKAKFVKVQNDAYLKVSYAWPFYASYVVFDLDEKHYQYAFVTSIDDSYLWLLSRTPKVSEQVMERFLKKSEKLGFDTKKLIFVNHD